MKTIDGKEIMIKKTGNTDITPNAYTVYIGTVKIAGSCTGSEARKIAEDLNHSPAEHVAQMMDLSW